MMGNSIESKSTSSKRNVGILAVGILLAAFALLAIAENGMMSDDRRRLLSNKNHNNHKVTENVKIRDADIASVPRAPQKEHVDEKKLENNNSAKKSINKPNAAAVHEWKASHADSGTDADATERNLYRKCPPGVDSVTGSFCGLSYEQICCFCPQPLDCDNGCPADADGIVRDGCFHSITIPCPDVDCNVDQMTDRVVELGG